MDHKKLKQIIIVRRDLGMRRGKEIAQGAHASLKATLEHMDDPYVKAWLDHAFAKIAVSVNSEEELLDIYEKAKDAGMACALIQDAGRTEFAGVPTYTTAAVGPGDPDLIQELTGHLKLR